MSLFSKLFGGGGSSEPEPVMHEGFAIFAEPAKDGSGYRIAARIEKEVGGAVKSHMLIRADTVGSLDEAVDASVAKAKRVIDELGDRIFD
ncbi:MAG: HlyU family transcriptional regulator [Pseudomonadota bacterium]